MDLKLRGKVAVVTGSSRGIGLATAKAFAAEGCRVMLSARSTEQLRETEEALRATGAEVAAHAADVGSPDDAVRLIEATVAAYGGIGIRVNTVSPGSILVEGNGWDRYRLANPDYFDDYVRHGFPMGRLGTAEEVADVIVFIASSRAHWINGRNIPVDGLEQPHAPLDRRPY